MTGRISTHGAAAMEDRGGQDQRRHRRKQSLVDSVSIAQADDVVVVHLRLERGHPKVVADGRLKAVKRVDDPMVVAFRLQPCFELALRRHQSVRAELELDE